MPPEQTSFRAGLGLMYFVRNIVEATPSQIKALPKLAGRIAIHIELPSNKRSRMSQSTTNYWW